MSIVNRESSIVNQYRIEVKNVSKLGCLKSINLNNLYVHRDNAHGLMRREKQP